MREQLPHLDSCFVMRQQFRVLVTHNCFLLLARRSVLVMAPRRSTCLTFVACLAEIRDWSRAHPDHAPILIMLNAKTGGPSMPGGTTPLDFDAAAWDALDAEVRSVFDADHLIMAKKKGKKKLHKKAK
jgi:hypothetical protein